MNRKALVLLISLLFLVSAVAVADDNDRRAQKRTKIDAVAAQALQDLLAKSDNARALHGKAYGYAVFDNWKFAFGVSGGGGTGVAVAGDGSRRTYMKMGSGGIGLGLGGQKYQLIVMMETKAAFDRFVDTGWQADAQGQAAGGNKGASASGSFHDGIALFQITEKGLMASVDVTGTKFWKHKKLN